MERGKFLIAYFCQNLFYPLLPNINAASAKVEGPPRWSLPPASPGRNVWNSIVAFTRPPLIWPRPSIESLETESGKSWKNLAAQALSSQLSLNSMTVWWAVSWTIVRPPKPSHWPTESSRVVSWLLRCSAWCFQPCCLTLTETVSLAFTSGTGPMEGCSIPGCTLVGTRVRWRLRPKCQPWARYASGDGQLFLSLRQLWSHYQHQKDQRNVSASSRKPVSRAADIAGFHMTSLKLSWDFTFMIYKSSSKLLFRQIFAPNGFLVFYAFGWRGIYMPGERAVMLVKTVTYFGEFGYLNSSCIRTSIILRFFSFPRDTSRFCSKTQWQMFLLVSGRHVGAHPDGHQYGSLHTNLNKFGWKVSSHILHKTNCCGVNLGECLHIYLLSCPRFWTLSIERFLFWFWFILNGWSLGAKTGS